MYKGKEVCQGCQKTGIEAPRWDKERLCNSCQSILEIGKAEKHEKETEYTHIFQHYHAFRNEMIGKLAIEIIGALNNPTAKTTTTEQGGFKYSSGSNGIRACIPSNTFEPLKKFFNEAEELFNNHRKEVDGLPKIIEERLSEERNRIYNEGIEAGRDLLNQLNRGEVTIDDFNKTVIKY